MKSLFAFVLFFFVALAFAQNPASISGKLLDKDYDNNPLAFATVSVKGSIIETTSDIDGNFTFNNLKAGEHTLVFSFLGYKNKELKVNVVVDETYKVSVTMEAYSPTTYNATTASSKRPTNNNTQVVTSS